MENNDQVNEPISTYSQPESFQQVWQLFKETDKQFKETDRKIQETDRILSEKFRETRELFTETDKRIRKLDQLFTSQWGKLVESLVEGDLVKLLNSRGRIVDRTLQRIKGNHQGQNFEFDIIAVNRKEVVIVEVKTTLRPQDVDDFHEKLWKAKVFMPEYQSMAVYCGVAFITSEGSSDRMAEKMGFFVIRATGSSSTIINSNDFKPKVF